MTQASRVRTPPAVRYDTDVYGWAMEQARFIREGRWSDVDRDNVAEEIESVGRSERSALVSSLARVMQHLLKWEYQPERRTRSWVRSIEVHRIHVRRQLTENPGLKGQLPAILDDAYRLALAFAIEETELERSAFPSKRPYDLEALMSLLVEWDHLS